MDRLIKKILILPVAIVAAIPLAIVCVLFGEEDQEEEWTD